MHSTKTYKNSFCRGLPPPSILQNTGCARFLKHAVANGGISTEGMTSDQKEHPVVDYILKKGWLHNTNDKFYQFPSSIHWWRVLVELHVAYYETYDITYVLCPEFKEVTIPYESPLELVIAAIHHFIPSTLSVSPHSVQKPEHLLKDHYQKEFYRSLYSFVHGELLTSPEDFTKRNQNGGAIDFYLPGAK